MNNLAFLGHGRLWILPSEYDTVGMFSINANLTKEWHVSRVCKEWHVSRVCKESFSLKSKPKNWCFSNIQFFCYANLYNNLVCEKLKIQCRYIWKENKESLLYINTHLLLGSCTLKSIKIKFILHLSSLHVTLNTQLWKIVEHILTITMDHITLLVISTSLRLNMEQEQVRDECWS